jgi:PPM family protein phosphatase
VAWVWPHSSRGEFVRIVSGGVTDVGRVRANNEDCYRVVEPLNLFVLSDGMGGEAHGEIASALAVETVAKHCLEAENNPAAPVFGETQAGWSAKTKRLSSAVHLANKKIFQSAQEHDDQRGMGATLTAVWIDGSKLSLAHVGDSRAYLLRAGTLQQLTRDHSLVAEQVRQGILTAAEADESEMQSVLIRALGAQEDIDVDAEEYQLFPRDILLLCSDGLTRMVTDPEIAGNLQAETDAMKAAEKLVALANERGGDDNITVVIVRAGAESNGWFSWLRRGARRKAAGNGSAGGK